MNRLGLLPPAELSPVQHNAYSVMEQYTTTAYKDKFIYMDAEKRLVGPFGIHVHHPEVALAFIQFAKALKTIPGLTPEVRECAILGVGSRLNAAYEEYAHQCLSGFSQSELKMLHHGSCPEHFSPAQKTAFRVALALGKPGPLPEDIWDEAVEILGKDGATALVHYVGFYSYVSTILNGFDAKTP